MFSFILSIKLNELMCDKMHCKIQIHYFFTNTLLNMFLKVKLETREHRPTNFVEQPICMPEIRSYGESVPIIYYIQG